MMADRPRIDAWKRAFRQGRHPRRPAASTFGAAFGWLVGPAERKAHPNVLDVLARAECAYAARLRSELAQHDAAIGDLKAQQAREYASDHAPETAQRHREERDTLRRALTDSIVVLAGEQRLEYRRFVLALHGAVQRDSGSLDSVLQRACETAAPLGTTLAGAIAEAQSSAAKEPTPADDEAGAPPPMQYPPTLGRRLQKTLSSLSLDGRTADESDGDDDARSDRGATNRSVFRRLGTFLNRIGDADVLSGRRPSTGSSTSSLTVENPPTTPASETFTLYVGTQVRRMYTLQLLGRGLGPQLAVPDDGAQERAIRAATLCELYAPQRLKAAIVVVRSSEFSDAARPEDAAYVCGRGTSNGALFAQALAGGELHFDSLAAQLAASGAALPSWPPRQGDVLVTRHSSLPSVHLVLHLVVDDDSLAAPLTLAAPVVQGLRNILALLDGRSFTHVTLPLALLPDSLARMPGSAGPADIVGKIGDPVEFAAQRCGVVVRALKGSLFELGRLAKHGHVSSAAASRCITALLPLPDWLVLASPSAMQRIWPAGGLAQSGRGAQANRREIRAAVARYLPEASGQLVEQVREQVVQVLSVD